MKTISTMSQIINTHAFQISSIALLVFSLLLPNGKAYDYLVESEKRHFSMLENISAIRLVLNELDSLEIKLITGKIHTINTSIEKYENIVFISSVSTIFLRTVYDISKSKLFLYSIFLLVIITLFLKRSTLIKKSIILLFFVNPGLSIYTICTHHLSVDFKDHIESGLHNKLNHISKNLLKEKTLLLQQKEDSIENANKENGFHRFIDHLKSNIIYDVSMVEDNTKSDYEMIHSILKMGTLGIMKEIIYFCAHFLIFTLAIPILYIFIIYFIATRKINRSPINIKDLENKLTRKINEHSSSITNRISALEPHLLKNISHTVSDIKNNIEDSTEGPISLTKKTLGNLNKTIDIQKSRIGSHQENRKKYI